MTTPNTTDAVAPAQPAQAGMAKLWAAFARLKNAIGNEVGFPEIVEAPRAFTLAAFEYCEAAAPQMPVAEAGWQPISSAPKDGTPVLIAEKGRMAGAWYVDAAENWFDSWEGFGPQPEDRWQAREGGETVCRNPTHWMPLPKPPEDRDDR